MSDNETNKIYSDGRDVYFYSEVNRDSALELTKELTKAYKVAKQNDLPINLHIQSFGGHVYAGLSIVDMIYGIRKSVPVYTYVEGVAASAGSLISVSGTARYMTPHSSMLIHPMRGGVGGTLSDIKGYAQGMVYLESHIFEIYKERSKLSKKELRELLDAESWLTADMALEYGFIDHVTDVVSPFDGKRLSE